MNYLKFPCMTYSEVLTTYLLTELKRFCGAEWPEQRITHKTLTPFPLGKETKMIVRVFSSGLQATQPVVNTPLLLYYT